MSAKCEEFDFFHLPGLDLDFHSLNFHNRKKKKKRQGKLFRPQLCSSVVLSVMCSVVSLLGDCQDIKVRREVFF